MHKLSQRKWKPLVHGATYVVHKVVELLVVLLLHSSLENELKGIIVSHIQLCEVCILSVSLLASLHHKTDYVNSVSTRATRMKLVRSNAFSFNKNIFAFGSNRIIVS